MKSSKKCDIFQSQERPQQLSWQPVWMESGTAGRDSSMNATRHYASFVPGELGVTYRTPVLPPVHEGMCAFVAGSDPEMGNVRSMSSTCHFSLAPRISIVELVVNVDLRSERYIE